MGKTTFFLPKAIKLLHAQGKKVAVSAATSAAAGELLKIKEVHFCMMHAKRHVLTLLFLQLIDLVTITTAHEQGGIGIADATVEDLKVKFLKKIKSEWSKYDAWCIDEFPMLGTSYLCKLNELLKCAFDTSQFMGGIQMFLSWCFF